MFTINIIRLPRSAYGNETNILEFKSNIPKDAGDDSWIPTFQILEENITQPTQWICAKRSVNLYFEFYLSKRKLAKTNRYIWILDYHIYH